MTAAAGRDHPERDLHARGGLRASSGSTSTGGGQHGGAASRRLVVSFIATVGNYEYGFYWYFYQDGAIQLEVKMTGVISNGAEPPGAKPIWGELVAPQVYGPSTSISSTCGWT